MHKSDFLERVQERGGLASPDEAAKGAVAVLNLVRHRLGHNEAQRVQSQLTPELEELWNSDDWYTTFLKHFRSGHYQFDTPEEFFHLVEEELEEQNLKTPASRVTAAVLHTLKEAINQEEIATVGEHLPLMFRTYWIQA